MTNILSSVSSLNSRRRISQAIFFILFCSVSISGFVRFDLPAMTMYLAGRQITISDVIFMYMFWGMMVPLLLFLYAFFGRGICGWACPQTLMSEYATRILFFITGKREISLKKSEHVHTRDKVEHVMLMSTDDMLKSIQNNPKNRAAKSNSKLTFQQRYVYTLLAILLAIAVSALFSFAFVSYFAPATYVTSGLATLLTGSSSPFGAVTSAQWFIFVFVLMMMNLLYWRHGWCKTLCPYGIWQFLWRTKNAMRVIFDNRKKEDCVDCDMCRRACFMEVEPRDNPETQFDCINCGKCIDACTTVLSRKNKPSLLKFGFGWSPTNAEIEAGIKKKTPLIMYALPVIFLISAIHLGYSLLNYIPVAMSVSRNEHYMLNNKIDLAEFNHYVVSITNKSNEDRDYMLQAVVKSVTPDKIIWDEDPQAIHLKKGETRKVKFYINVKTAQELLNRDNNVIVIINDKKNAKYTITDKAKMFTKG